MMQYLGNQEHEFTLLDKKFTLNEEQIKEMLTDITDNPCRIFGETLVDMEVSNAISFDKGFDEGYDIGRMDTEE